MFYQFIKYNLFLTNTYKLFESNPFLKYNGCMNEIETDQENGYHKI